MQSLQKILDNPRNIFPFNYDPRAVQAQVLTAAAAEKATAERLGTNGTTGINPPKTQKTDKQTAAPSNTDRPAPPSHKWEKEHAQRKKVLNQAERLRQWNEQKNDNWSIGKDIARAAANLESCGRSFLIEKKPGKALKYIHSFHCKQKFCPRCRKLKSDALSNRLLAFFELIQEDKAAREEKRNLLENYDLAMLTVTLAHGPGKARNGWYFEELKTHYRNALKYGAFNKYIKGSIYSTETTVTSNGFHIHRHALVLVPKTAGIKQTGTWTQTATGKWQFEQHDRTIQDRLRAQWYKRTGDSWNVDIRPLNPHTPFLKNVREVLKYIEYDQEGSVNPVLCAQIVSHKREKWSGRTGELAKVGALAINAAQIGKPAAEKWEPDPDHIYIGVGLRKSGRGFGFCRYIKIDVQDGPILQQMINLELQEVKKKRTRQANRAGPLIHDRNDDFENQISDAV